MKKDECMRALPAAKFEGIAAILEIFHNFVPISDLLVHFLPFLEILLQILAIYTCHDHALFAASSGPPKSNCCKFVSF